LNFLAHLRLSDSSDDALLGALFGDFVKGPIDADFPPAIADAIRLHRRIDTFTDAHATVLVSKRRVSPQRRRYAGIMVDMFYDHFLARHWRDYALSDLARFTERVYALLRERQAQLPERLQRIAPSMIEFDWLGSYQHLDSIDTALNGMSSRLRRENSLPNSVQELVGDYQGFESDFRQFFPDAIEFARRAADAIPDQASVEFR
jgi:acyl carrier protein phosphodiesterase